LTISLTHHRERRQTTGRISGAIQLISWPRTSVRALFISPVRFVPTNVGDCTIFEKALKISEQFKPGALVTVFTGLVRGRQNRFVIPIK
jgi:hypothetical protein